MEQAFSFTLQQCRELASDETMVHQQDMQQVPDVYIKNALDIATCLVVTQADWDIVISMDADGVKEEDELISFYGYPVFVTDTPELTCRQLKNRGEIPLYLKR